MKMNWTVQGTINFKQGASTAIETAWSGLTLTEAETELTKIVRAEMHKPTVHGINIIARAHSKAGHSLLQKVEWK